MYALVSAREQQAQKSPLALSSCNRTSLPQAMAHGLDTLDAVS